MTQEEIMGALTKNRDELRRFHVNRLGLFGSYARGEQNEGSDLDFLVNFETKSFDNYMDLKFYLIQETVYASGL